MEELIKILREKIQSQSRNQESWAMAILDQQIKIRKMFHIQRDSDPFTPYYPPDSKLSPIYPEVYSETGDRMRFFFLRDKDVPHVPYYACERFIIWDRFNYGLENHFYTSDEIFKPIGNPKHKFGILMEPRPIKNQMYDELFKRKEWIEKEFDLIFTFDSEVLEKFSNARFVPICAKYWLIGHMGNFSDEEPIIPPDIYKRKSKMISMIASRKNACELHRFRQNLAWKCKNEKLADTFGGFDGGRWFKIAEPFLDYRYSIAVENDISPVFFTEKIMHCFAAQTVPIYLGATDIGKFFNMDGIIQFRVEDFDRFDEILKQCTIEDYQRRL